MVARLRIHTSHTAIGLVDLGKLAKAEEQSASIDSSSFHSPVFSLSRPASPQPPFSLFSLWRGRKRGSWPESTLRKRGCEYPLPYPSAGWLLPILFQEKTKGKEGKEVVKCNYF